MKKRWLLLLTCCGLLCFMVNGNAIEVNGITWTIGDVSYTTNTTLDFYVIDQHDTWIKFNDTDFNVSTVNPLNITIMFLSNDMVNASADILLLDFYANTTGGLVMFNIGGFNVSTGYVVKRGGVTVNTTDSNGSGVLSFSNSVWSEQHFQIYRSDGITGGTRQVKIIYEHDKLGSVYSKGVTTIGLFSLVMIFLAIGLAIFFLSMVNRGD